MIGFVFLVAVICFIAGGVWYLIHEEDKAANQWHIVALGDVVRIERHVKHMTRRSGAMVHTTHHYDVIYNDIWFVGNTCLFHIRGDFEDITGPAQLLQNDNGKYELRRG